ncbi:hypothetical protein PHSY_005676 [Pseudozyma hubeiensis SY62]|uniref:Uncharacterized protein n=1 Tax=Pseudozyma hubeiensis (strain SY62) TaxID=1305764 RepID=R9PA06_PSEHS|nr:hypothetical protein PHSY_005676 [Pseudozyma hubeiensis SY62]GAC98087.1 hypothetical protein PHSY_005676 [Pseudozyma hubeiensis SY62]
MLDRHRCWSSSREALSDSDRTPYRSTNAAQRRNAARCPILAADSKGTPLLARFSTVMEAMPTPDISGLQHQCASGRKRQARSSMCASVTIQSRINAQGLRTLYLAKRIADQVTQETAKCCILMMLAFL